MPRVYQRTATSASSDAGCLQSSVTTPSNVPGSPLDRSCCAWTSLMAASEVGANILPPSLPSEHLNFC